MYMQLLSIMSVYFKSCFEVITDEPRFDVLHNTWRIGRAPDGCHLFGFG